MYILPPRANIWKQMFVSQQNLQEEGSESFQNLIRPSQFSQMPKVPAATVVTTASNASEMAVPCLSLNRKAWTKKARAQVEAGKIEIIFFYDFEEKVQH